MTTKVYQIFVSSTYADLADERRRVSETLAKAGYIPVGMELFPATDQKQLDFIKRIIDRTDYYVAIIGGRYGSLADGNVSFTEKEYDYAVSKQIPVLAFLHGSPDKIEVGKTDRNELQAERLKAFRDRVVQGRIVDFWNEPQDLCTKVVIAVAQAINLTPGIGWVRGDEAIDPKVLQEVERLRVENNDLQKRLAEHSRDVSFPDHLIGPADEIDFAVESETSSGIARGVRLGDLFSQIFDDLLTDPSEYNMRWIIGSGVAKLTLKEQYNPNGEYQVSEEDVQRLRYQYEALGLIEARGAFTTGEFAGRQFREEYIAWTVTDKGRRFVVQAKAMPRKKSC